ncbi:MAG: hypothetical protein ACYCUZ_07520 [Cuniculiplasma sp.]|jgi:hypothetical protein
MGIAEIREEIISRKIIYYVEEHREIPFPLKSFMLMLSRNNPFMEATAMSSRNFSPEEFRIFLEKTIFSGLKGNESDIASQSEERFEEFREQSIKWINATYSR